MLEMKIGEFLRAGQINATDLNTIFLGDRKRVRGPSVHRKRPLSPGIHVGCFGC